MKEICYFLKIYNDRYCKNIFFCTNKTENKHNVKSFFEEYKREFKYLKAKFSNFDIEYTYSFTGAFTNEIKECIVNNFDILKKLMIIKNKTTKMI